MKLPLASSHGAFLYMSSSECLEILYDVISPPLQEQERVCISQGNVAYLYPKGTSGKALDLLVCFSYISHRGVIWWNVKFAL